MRELFGSIAGGSSFKFGLFYHKKSQSWMTGSPVKPQTLTEEQAIEVAGTIRDKLVAGAKMIEADADTLSSVSAYEKLYQKLQSVTNIDWVWVLKYYQMLFPGLLQFSMERISRSMFCASSGSNRVQFRLYAWDRYLCS